MAKIMRQTLREQVTQAIRMKLLTGQLKPGTRIVEQEMAEELGVSRGPVREALRQIEQEGLVEYASHVGCFVKDFNAQDVYEVYLLRANLEILSVKMCDGKFSSQTIEHMEQIVQRMASIEQVEQFDEIIDNDNEFHECIIRECGLNRLYLLWNSMDGGILPAFSDPHFCHLPNFFKGELYRGAGKSEYVVRNQANIHRKVLDAVRTGDVKLICQTLLDHYMETTVSYLWEHGISAEEFPYKINFTL